MRLSIDGSKRSLHKAYETGKRGLNWVDKRMKHLENALNIAAPVVGVLQPDLIPSLFAAKSAFRTYNHARTIAMAGDQVKKALTP